MEIIHIASLYTPIIGDVEDVVRRIAEYTVVQ